MTQENKINDGDFAFPQPMTAAGNPVGHEYASCGGMSLRDYFAVRAMQSLIAKFPLMDREGEWSQKFAQETISTARHELSESAYFYADAMLAARSNESRPTP